MGQRLHTQINIEQGQHLMPMQVQFVRLLEMTRQEAEERLEQELSVNPALSTADNQEQATTSAQFAAANGDIPSYMLRAVHRHPADSTASAREIAIGNFSEEESLYEHLRHQLDERQLPLPVHKAADYIIGNLDPNGYLRRSVPAMIDDIAFTSGDIVEPEDMQKALDVVRSLDPVGVGASGLQDSLAMQLRALPQSTTRDNALRIILDAFEALSMRHPHKIISALKLERKEYEEAIKLIHSLNPRPGASYGSGDSFRDGVVVPDFAVEEDESGELHVSIPSNTPDLAIAESFNTAYADMERNAKMRKQKGREAGNAFIQRKYREAQDFIEIWKQRQTTLLSVMTAIVKLQYRYFITSDESELRPMVLRDIAEMTGYDLSTVSRATSGKYVATSWGIIPLRHLFSERMASDKEESGGSARSVQAALRKLVDNEDKHHPLSDEQLTKMLNEAGHSVKRRTVAKYRELLNIQPSRLRRSL